MGTSLSPSDQSLILELRHLIRPRLPRQPSICNGQQGVSRPPAALQLSTSSSPTFTRLSCGKSSPLRPLASGGQGKNACIVGGIRPQKKSFEPPANSEAFHTEASGNKLRVIAAAATVHKILPFLTACGCWWREHQGHKQETSECHHHAVSTGAMSSQHTKGFVHGNNLTVVCFPERL